MITENRKKYTAIFEGYSNLYKHLSTWEVHQELNELMISQKELSIKIGNFLKGKSDVLILHKTELSEEFIKAIRNYNELEDVEFFKFNNIAQTITVDLADIKDEEGKHVDNRTSIPLLEAGLRDILYFDHHFCPKTKVTFTAIVDVDKERGRFVFKNIIFELSKKKK